MIAYTCRLTRYCRVIIFAIAIFGCVQKKTITVPDSSVNASNNTSNYSIEEYTSDCLQALDISAKNTPEFSCEDFVYNTRHYTDSNGKVASANGRVSSCMNPDGAGNSSCTSLSSGVGTSTFLTLNSSDKLIAFVLMCSGSFEQIIAHRFDTGGTCFFEDGSSLQRPSEFHDPAEYVNGGRSCVTCHSPYPFTNTPLIKTINLEKKLKVNVLENSIASLGQEGAPAGVKRLLTPGLMEGKSPSELRELYDQNGSKILQINGTPSNVYRTKENFWGELKYNVIQKEKLESLTKPGVWQFEYYDDPELKACLTCHKLSAKHHSARTSATVMGFCDVPNKANQVCRGLETNSLSIHKNSVPHNTFYGTELRLSEKLKTGLTNFVGRCLGRSGTDCKSQKVDSNDSAGLFESLLLVSATLSCSFQESLFSSRNLSFKDEKSELFELGFLLSSELNDLQIGIACTEKLQTGAVLPLKTKHFTRGSVSKGQKWCLKELPDIPDFNKKLVEFAKNAELDMKNFVGKCE